MVQLKGFILNSENSSINDEEEKVPVLKDFVIEQEPEQSVLPGQTFDTTSETSSILETKPSESTYEGFFTEAREGVVSGLIGIPQGIIELGASAIDLAADTDYATDVTEGFDRLRQNLGVDPEGTFAKILEVGTQFVVPGGFAISAVSKGSKLGKLAAATKAKRASIGAEGGIASLTTAQKFGLNAQKAAAAGLVDAAVATDDITTIGDFFEGGPTMTNQEVGLKGREEALRRLGNKFKIGIEATGVGAAAPYLIAGIGKAAEPVTKAIGDTSFAQKTGEIIKKPIDKVGQLLDDIEERRVLNNENQGSILNAFADTLAVFRYRGYLPDEVATQRLLIPSKVGAETRKAFVTLRQIERGVDDALKSYEGTLKRDTPLLRQEVFNNIEDFLTKDASKVLDETGELTTRSVDARKAKLEAYNNIPDNVKPFVRKARIQIDKLSKEIANSDAVKAIEGIDAFAVGKLKGKTGEQVAEDIRKSINKNLNSYMRRRYRAFEDAKYVPDEATRLAGIEGYKRDKFRLAQELKNIEGQDFSEFLTQRGKIRKNVTDDQLTELATKAVDSFLSRYRIGNVNKSGKIGIATQKVFVNKLNKGLFDERVNLAGYQKALLGEIKDFRESFLGTIADLSTFKATDDYFSSIRSLSKADPNGVGKLFVSPDDVSRFTKSELDNNFQQLNSTNIDSPITSFGSLEGFYVRTPVFKNLQRTVLGDTDVLTNTVKASYSYFLKGKAAAQYGKTVLSPITQIRNFTTASLFALAQGNVGRHANLMESMRLGFSDIVKLPTKEAIKKLEEYEKLGILGTQAQVQELRQIIKEGLGYRQDTVDGIRVGREFGSKLMDNSFIGFLGKSAKKFEDAYQASDNVWKIYNFDFERGKLLNALRGYKEQGLTGRQSKLNYLERNSIEKFDTTGKTTKEIDEHINKLINEEAGYIVRNTVPNYNMSPQVIQLLRRSPVGNFIAFPYEIMRTGVNTIKLGLDELASNNPGIRANGIRRLSGASATFAILPAAIAEFAYATSGVSEDQMKAYQRSFAPPWEKNARLIPLGRNEEGQIIYLNYSYSNPYDLLERIVHASINKFETTRLEGGNSAEAVFDAVNESMSEFIKPFTEESILLGKLRDTLDPESEKLGIRQLANVVGGRSGQTITGARVYNPQDDVGTKSAKIFAHILDGFLPGASPFGVKGGEFVPGRFARGVFGGHLGISAKDRQGRLRKLNEELVRGITGVAHNTIDTNMGLKYKGYEFAENRRNSSTIFNSVARRANVTRDELIQAYIEADNARFQVFDRFNRIVNDMRSIGLSDYEIKRTLKRNGITDVNPIVNGVYKPLEVSNSVKKEMRRNGTFDQYPLEEISRLRVESRKRTFSSEVEEQEEGQKITVPREEKTDVSLAPTQDVKPNVTIPVLKDFKIENTDPSLLGGNIIDQAKNLQILQRRNQ